MMFQMKNFHIQLHKTDTEFLMFFQDRFFVTIQFFTSMKKTGNVDSIDKTRKETQTFQSHTFTVFFEFIRNKTLFIQERTMITRKQHFDILFNNDTKQQEMIRTMSRHVEKNCKNNNLEKER